MDILLIVVFLLLGITELVIYIMVLIKLFKDKGILHGIFGIICGIYPFIWGWMAHKRLNITKLMTIWTTAGIISMGLQVFMGDPDDLMKGMEDRDKVKAVKVVKMRKEPAAVRAPQKKKAGGAAMVAVSDENRRKSAEWSTKAQALWKDGKYAEPQNALRYLDLAVGLNPNDAVLYNNRGLTKRDLGRYEKAVEDYSRAIELAPKYALAYNNRGVANYELAQYEEAIKDYSQAIRLDPKYVDAYFNQALANYQLDEIDRMCNFFEKACELGTCDGLNWAKEESLCK